MDNLKDLQAQIVQNHKLEKQLKEALDKIKELEHTIEDYYDTVEEFDNLKSKFSTSSWGGTRIR